MTDYIVTINGHEYPVTVATAVAAVMAALWVYDDVYRVRDQPKLTIKVKVKE